MSLRRTKVARVARRELWTTITRPGFIVSTVAMPLLPLVVILLQGLIDPEAMLGGPDAARVGIVDLSGMLDLEAITPQAAEPVLPGGLKAPFQIPSSARRVLEELGAEPTGRPRDVYLAYPDPERARADLLAGALTGYVVVPEDWLARGEVEAFQVKREDGTAATSPFGTRLGDAIRWSALHGRVPSELAQRVVGVAAARVDHVLDAEGREVSEALVGEDIRRFVVPLMAALFLMVALFAGAGYLLLGLSEEKENRVLELLLASLTPDELLTGKLLGIGGAGLLQFSVWVGLIAVPFVILAPMLGITFAQLLWATGFFLAGYAFFGALMLGVGAVTDTARHAQQLSGVFTLLATLPLMFNFIILQEPGGTLARVLSFVPFTAPVTVMLRLASSNLPVWEPALALVLLTISAWLALLGAARVFRVSLLLHGNRPSLRDLRRWLAAAP